MAVHLIEPVAPTLRIPRAHPCGAFLELIRTHCGATPALLFRRVCAHNHVRDVYLCAVHERAVSAAGIVTCRECANLPGGAHACPVALVRVPEAVDLIRAARLPPATGGIPLPGVVGFLRRVARRLTDHPA